MTQDRILPGKISIARHHPPDGREVLRFKIRDNWSRSIILTFDVEPHALMLALTGLPEQPIGALWTYLERLGKTMENKVEQIEMPNLPPGSPLDELSEALRNAAKPFEVDGWSVRLSDFMDARRRVRHGVQAVTFFRWVDKPEEAHAPT